VKRCCLLAVTVLFCACGSTTEPPHSPVVYEVNVFAGPLFGINDFATSANRGDTLSIRVQVYDSTSAHGSLVTVRATCAVNVTILHAGTTVATLPQAITCPDSSLQETVGAQGSFFWDSRFYGWVVPTTLSPGVYTIRGEVLVQPALSASTTLQVN
jgi:hypothetical protein